ncbi:MAG: polyprenyl synthetase family protein [Firmicutes bacterium]|nr:polyprenyl synthetase family protein [Bacillota bacterium]MCL1953396.1 polyprenyl synthetase family protein [Bacillota bacterium]
MADKPKSNNFNKNAFVKAQQNYSQRIERVLESIVQDLQYPHRLLDAIKYSLLAGGKRMRPSLFYATLNMFNKPLDDKADIVAVSIECIHTYSLIHDDLPCMDDDKLRRGKATNHVLFGEAIAMLAGNALLNLAYEQLLSLASYKPYWHAAMCISSFSGGMGMIGGQAEDMALDEFPNSERLKYVYLKKTSSLFSSCLLSAGLIAGADTKHLKLLSEFSNAFGFAFQLKDDLDEHINGTFIEKKIQKYNWIQAHGESDTIAQLESQLDICKECLTDLSADFNLSFFRGLLIQYFG